MAEVVLHLVRDEYVEHEPDIEDIDSTLEQIDEQSEAFEEVLATPVEAESVPGAIATGSADSVTTRRYARSHSFGVSGY